MQTSNHAKSEHSLRYFVVRLQKGHISKLLRKTELFRRNRDIKEMDFLSYGLPGKNV